MEREGKKRYGGNDAVCSARTIMVTMAMSVALLLGLVPSAAHAAASRPATGSTTEGLAVQALKAPVSEFESSQFQLSASKNIRIHPKAALARLVKHAHAIAPSPLILVVVSHAYVSAVFNFAAVLRR